MIVLYNPHPHPYNIQYVNGQQSYRKEIVPFTITGFQHLTGLTQITNLSFLQSKGITAYDTTNNVYPIAPPTSGATNQGMNPWSTGYTGFITVTGVTFSTGLMTNSSGFTFICSAASINTMALNSCTASTIGSNTITAAYSGASCSTNTYLAALATTAFSGWSISTAGSSSTNYLTSGASISFTLSSNTTSTIAAFTTAPSGVVSLGNGLAYVMLDNTPLSSQPTFNALSGSSCYTAMALLT